MAAPTQIVEGLWQLSLGSVNVFLLHHERRVGQVSRKVVTPQIGLTTKARFAREARRVTR